MRPTFTPRALLLGILFACGWMGMPAEAAAQIRVPFDAYTLDNGLSVILHEDHSAPVIAVVVMYHVGSKNEKPGRTGFAHLFEHMMFQGSDHVGDDEHFRLLQEVGGNVNGTTNNDRTNYFEVVPSNQLELSLYLESDRMGFLLSAMTQEKLDNQRDVVKNERRQNYDNQPYGRAWETIARGLYGDTHPYGWPVIGSMDDLSAASLEDVKNFFRLYYAPNNAVLSVAGDFDSREARALIQKYFGPLPRGAAVPRPAPPPVKTDKEKRLVLEDRVQLPRLYMAWTSHPLNTRGDALMDVLTDILSRGKNSRLYRTLVYDRQIAQSVSAYQYGMEIGGQLIIDVTPKPGRTPAELEEAVRVEIRRLLEEGVTEREIRTSLNNKEVDFIGARSTVLGKANALATYHTLTGDPGNFNSEFDRFTGITREEVQNGARDILGSPGLVLTIVPQGQQGKASPGGSKPPEGGLR
ncbi:MAG: pitrilysin family protein [Bacteroidota bacterium]